MVATDSATAQVDQGHPVAGPHAGRGQGGTGPADEGFELAVGVLAAVHGQGHPVGHPFHGVVGGVPDVHRWPTGWAAGPSLVADDRAAGRWPVRRRAAHVAQAAFSRM